VTDVTATAGVDIARTRVTGRRIVQYLVDLFLAGLVLSILGALLNLVVPDAGFQRVTGGFAHLDGLTGAGGWPSVAAVLLTLVVWLAVFVAFPIRGDRTPGMMLLGLRIVRADGGRPTSGQHLGRALLLVVDSFFGGLVGWLVIIGSERRQRVGDHAAGTMVLRA
jgi:uncharacterized RDD family membrane protein YckC